MTDIAVRRRFRKDDFFQKQSQGYIGSSKETGAGTGSSKHWECQRLEELLSHDVNYTYPTPFKTQPIGLNTVCAFRFEPHPEDPSGLVKTNVLIYFPINLNPLTNLLIKIDSSEILEGVIIEFMLTE